MVVLPPADSEMLELRGSGCIASVLKVRQRRESSEKYICSVRHEGCRAEAPTGQGGEGFVIIQTCSKRREGQRLTHISL